MIINDMFRAASVWSYFIQALLDKNMMYCVSKAHLSFNQEATFKMEFFKKETRKIRS